MIKRIRQPDKNLTFKTRELAETTLSAVISYASKVADREREEFKKWTPIYTSSPSLSVATLADPPVLGGLTNCLSQLTKILIHNESLRSPTISELKQVGFATLNVYVIMTASLVGSSPSITNSKASQRLLCLSSVRR